PMKCQRNASPYSACFASRSCARFSPTSRTPASTSAAMSRNETYLVAATTVTPSPTCAWTCARRSRIRSGDGTDHPLDAARPAVPPVREEAFGMAAGAQVDPVDARHSGGAQRPLGRRPQVEPPSHGQVGVEERRDLVSHLVA